MAHSLRLIKNTNKNFLRKFVINKHYMTADEWDKNSDKLQLKFDDIMYSMDNPQQHLKNGDWNQFLYECFVQWCMDGDYLKDMMYIECHIDNNDSLTVSTVFINGKNIINEELSEELFFDENDMKFTGDNKYSKKLNMLNKSFDENSEIVLWISWQFELYQEFFLSGMNLKNSQSQIKIMMLRKSL